ncbi:DEAD/DEAH box helicase [Spiroplasma endosymbiont of Othius punctulatus]|uniref:DEAD/DEAH box helicase n=1 Tax=Spiroplasma endosymbiont of Othius punctulatus TaxID=3066289 RepID=UPI0030D54683
MKFTDYEFKQFINDSLDELKFESPTLIQQKVIPLLNKKESVIAQSQTGTGKTHSFLLPIMNNFDFENLAKIQCVIITPTRELARQIFANVKQIIKFNPEIKAQLLIGGEELNSQINNLKVQPTIVVGTPTRLKRLYEDRHLKITTATSVVIDECDMIFDLGFIEDVDFLISKINNNAKVSLFSATMKEELKPFLKKYFTEATFINVVKENPMNVNIKNILIWTRNKENKLIFKILMNQINPYVCLVFVNTKQQVPIVIGWLKEFGITNIGELHAGLDPRQRTNMQKRIQNMEFKWIVATDIAARGIDIDGVSHVISVDLPNELEYYIHRSGRTGRNKYLGESYVLFNSQNQNLVDKLKEMNIEFSNMKVSEGQIVDIKVRQKKQHTKPTNTKFDIEQAKIINKFKGGKIKPGYKSKRKAEIEKLKKDVRRKHIKESIAKIKKERYTKRRKDLFDSEG